MAQTIDAVSAAAAQAAPFDTNRALPQADAAAPAGSGSPALTEDAAVEKVASMFLMQVFMLTTQETDKIRKNAEQQIKDMREEE